MQVQIAAYGQAGLDRVAAHVHPETEGVRWLVSVQDGGEEILIPENLALRKDFDIIVSSDKGVSKNRNHALDYACDSEIVLLSDDDVDYNEAGLKRLMEAFEQHPEADFICCRYKSFGEYTKNYGTGEFDVRKAPFGWYPTTFEMAYRRKKAEGIRFNENVGPGSGKLISGEDSVFYSDLLRKGLHGVGLPIDLCEHNGATTGERLATDPEFLKAKGACVMYEKPVTWFPRFLVHAHRAPIPFFKYLKYTIGGVMYARRERIFKKD